MNDLSTQAKVRYLIPGDEKPVYFASEGGAEGGEVRRQLSTDAGGRPESAIRGRRLRLDRDGLHLLLRAGSRSRVEGVAQGTEARRPTPDV